MTYKTGNGRLVLGNEHSTMILELGWAIAFIRALFQNYYTQERLESKII